MSTMTRVSPASAMASTSSCTLVMSTMLGAEPRLYQGSEEEVGWSVGAAVAAAAATTGARLRAWRCMRGRRQGGGRWGGARAPAPMQGAWDLLKSRDLQAGPPGLGLPGRPGSAGRSSSPARGRGHPAG
jgi:hypothetical protein